jgi:hypothetical protein
MVACMPGNYAHTLPQLGVYNQDICPFGPASSNPENPPRRTEDSNCTECFPGYDLSGDCSECLGAESIGCVEGEQDCSVSG